MIDPTLKQFAQTNSPQAFKAMVDRHGNAVYAQCVRELRDPHLAEDVTQAVFMVLARKAGSLPQSTVLPAWLFKVTRYACANARRNEQRRRRYEQEAAMMRKSQQPDVAAVNDLELVLDAALARLGRVDRQAVILRFYSGMNSSEVARNLGLSPEAAKRRISRAVEKLRAMLGRAGCVIPPAVLAARLDGIGTGATPPHLAEQIIMHAFNPAAASPLCEAVAHGVIQTMKWMQVKFAMTTAAILLAFGAGGIALTGAMAQNAPRPAAPAAALAGPVAQDVIDRTMIRATLQDLAQSIRVNDLSAIERLVVVPMTDNGHLAKSSLIQNAAYRRFQNAWTAVLSLWLKSYWKTWWTPTSRYPEPTPAFA